MQPKNPINPAIGLLGGTFDPIHLGHLHLGLSIFHALHLSSVRLIPCAQPLLKANRPVANAEQRCTMVRMAIEAHPCLSMDEREITRGGDSFTIDTLRSIREEVGKDTPLCFIMSIDQFSQFTAWHQWQQIPELAHLIVATRPGYAYRWNEALLALLQQRQVKDSHLLHQAPCGYIYVQSIIPLAISSTEIRANRQKGVDVRTWLPFKVWEYIEAKGVY